jgi:hypothetical protein
MGEIDELGIPGWNESSQGRRIRLQVVSDEGRWPVLTKDGPGDVSPFMSGKGDGGVDLVCGECEHLLVDGIYPADKIAGMVLCCPNCGASNLA